jgi:hypothetical protein
VSATNIHAAVSNSSAVAGDFNRDGKLDLVATDEANPNPGLEFLAGNGDGTFQPPVPFGPTDGTNWLVEGDFSGNGKLDLAFIDGYTGSGPAPFTGDAIAVMMGNGDGTFQAPVFYPVSGVSNLAVADFRNDGKLDLVAFADNHMSVDVLLGNGDGTFQSPIATELPQRAYSFTVADFNGDQKPDLAVGYGSTVGLLTGKGDGTFNASLTVINDPGVGIASADLSGNGKQDLVIRGGTVPGITILVAMGNGNGTFQAPVTYSFPLETETGAGGPVTLADVNGDGKPDILFSESGGPYAAVLLNKGNGTFNASAELRYEVGERIFIEQIVTGDFTGDGHMDIVTVTGANLSILLGNGDGTFRAAALTHLTFDDTGAQVVSGDLSGNGNTDLVVTGAFASGFDVFMADGNGSFQAPVYYAGDIGTNSDGVVLADLNNDGRPDVITTDPKLNDIDVFLNNGDGTFGTFTKYVSAGTGTIDVAAADLIGNGNMDIVALDQSDASNDGNGDISVFLGAGNGTLQNPVAYEVPGVPSGLVLANFDGKVDAVVTSSTGVYLLAGNADGTFQPATPIASNIDAISVAVGDFNGDHKNDVVVTQFFPATATTSASSQIDVFLGNGNGTFAAPSVASVPMQYAQGLLVGDYNADGVPDVVVGDGQFLTADGIPGLLEDSTVALLDGNGDGTFGTPHIFDSGSLSGSIANAFVRPDGATDLAFTNIEGLTLLKDASSTTTAAANASTTFGAAGQSLTLSATVTSPGGVVNEGTVTFTVMQGSTPVGTPAVSGTVSGGKASATYTLPAGVPVGSYTVQAVYNPDNDFEKSSDSSRTLTITPAATSTTATPDSAIYSTSAQSVALGASVASGGVGVSEGTVTFTVFASGNVQIGSPVTSGVLSGGNASAPFALPAGEPVGTYTVKAVYNPGPDYQGSSASSSALTISPAKSSTAAGNASTTFSTTSQSVTLSATVASGGTGVNEGTVTFTLFAAGNVQVGQPVTSSAVSGGNASVTYALPAGEPAGSYTVQAVYNPGPDYQGSSDKTHTLSITKAATATAGANGSAVFSSSSQALTFSATVTSGAVGINEGTVTFTVFTAGNVQVGQAATSGALSGGSGSATFNLPAGEPVGTYRIHAVYNPGNDYQGSSDATHALSISPASTSTVGASTPATFSPAAQSVTLSAKVTSGGANVSEGTVTFTVFDAGNVQVGQPVSGGTVSDGNASVAYALPAGQAVGTYTIQAVYNPGADYQGSTDAAHTLSIAKSATSTAAAPTSTPFSTSSQTLTLSAAVTSGGAGLNEGTVTFSVFAAGNVQVGQSVTSGTVSAGNASASFALPAGRPAGTYRIQSVYNPGPDCLASSDASHMLTVSPATSSTVAANASAPFSTGSQAVTVSANVTSGGANVNEGTLTFTLFTAGHVQVGQPVTSGTVSGGSGSAALNLPAGEPAGAYTIQAVYNPGPDYQGSSDATHTLTIGPALTTTAESNSTATFATSMQSVALQALVTSGGIGVSEGTVTFTVFTADNVQVGSAVTSSAVSAGNAAATFAVPAELGAGTYTIQAVYNPGPDYVGSTNATGTLNIAPAAATISSSVVSTAYSLASQPLQLSATVTGAGAGVNEGTVTFTVFGAGNAQIGAPVTSATVAGGNATATYTLPAGQVAGTYTIQAVYNPGPDYQTTTNSSPHLVVGPAATTLSAASASASFSATGESVTLSARVALAGNLGVNEGTVTFTVLAAGNKQVGTAVTSGTLVNGNASAVYTLPGGTVVGSYTIAAVYNPGPDCQTSTDSSQSLAVAAATTVAAAANDSAVFATASQTLMLGANVISNGLGVNEGSVTFTVLTAGNVQVGSAVTSGPVVRGAATAAFVLPAGEPAGLYTIEAVYSAGPDYQGSADKAHTLTIAPATTQTAAADATTVFNLAEQSVILSAAVTDGGSRVNEGSITFTLYSASLQQEGVATTSTALVNGVGSVTYELSGGLSAGSYTIQAVYNPGADYQGSTDSAHTLIVKPATTATTAAPAASATYSSGSQSVTLSANVTSGGVGVDEGVISYTVLQGTTIVGGPSVSGTVSGGVATASTTLLAGLAPGSYTVRAVYSDSGGDYATSDDSGQPGTLSVAAAPTSASVPTAQVAGSASAQSVTLQAQVTSTGGNVGQGAVTFTVLEGNTVIGAPVTSGTVSGGMASASFTVPAGTPVGLYTIQASYGGSTDYLAASPATGTLKVDGPPILPPINGTNVVTGTPSQLNAYAVALNASSPVGNALTYSVALAGNNPLYDLEQQYGFQGLTYYKSQGTLGYLLQANANNAFGNPFYLIRPNDGALFAYRGGTYADTFANVTPTAVLGSNVYTDPNLLVKAQEPINYSLLASLEQQYGFVGLQYYTNGGNAAYLLEANSNNRNGNLIYLLRSTDGALFAYGGGSYAATYAEPKNLVATLGAGVSSNPTLLTNAGEPLSLYSSLYQLNQHYDLQELNGSFDTNRFGHEAEWFFSPVLNQFGEPWYTLTLQTMGNAQKAVLTAWQGYADSEVGAVVATLDPSVYSHPVWLSGATAVPNPPAGTASVDASGKLSIGLPSLGFLGSFKVTVTASDGLLSTSQTAGVTCTDAAPTVTITWGSTPIVAGSTQSFPQGDFPQSYAASGASSNPSASVTVSAAVSNSSPLFALEEQYRFQGMQYYSNGGDPAYVLQSAANNRNGYPVYLLTPSGDLYAYAGGSYAGGSYAGGSYAATYADSSNHIASLGPLVYADPTLLTGALPAMDYMTLSNLQQQYHFLGLQYYTSGGSAAYLLQASSNNANGNPIYLLAPNGGLYAYAGGSYAATYADPENLVASLDPQVYAQPSLLTGAKAAPALYAELQTLESSYDLTGLQYYSNSGIRAYVLQAPQNNVNGNTAYLLLPTGALYAYGGGSYAQTTADATNLVAMLDPSVYATPALLTGAKARVAATGVTLTPTGSGASLSYTLNVPASFVGSFQVTVTATDGSRTSTESYRVTATDVPALTPIPAQTVSLSKPTLQLTLALTQPGGSPSTYTAKVAAYNPAYSLQQRYHFLGLGYYTTSDGVKVYSLQSATNNVNGNPLYLLSSTGGLYAYDGSSDFGTTLSNSANLVAQLGAAVYQTPSLLTNAQPPQAPAAQVNVAGNQLTLNVTGLSVGTVFEVIVVVNDGLATSQSSFLVTVTA